MVDEAGGFVLLLVGLFFSCGEVQLRDFVFQTRIQYLKLNKMGLRRVFSVVSGFSYFLDKTTNTTQKYDQKVEFMTF